MKAPICEVCLKTDDILCPADEKKLQEGIISELDVKVSRLLYKILGDVDIELKKAVEAGDLIVIIVGKGDVPVVIGKGGKNIKTLVKELGKRVRVIEGIENETPEEIKKLATDLFYPATVFGVNIVYKPGGGHYYKILIPARERKRLPEKPELLESIVGQVVGSEVKVSFI
ncbi:transcription elongation factor NusA [Thermococcus profundus]|uniref:Transcription elongation factor NusA n=1 Tax=Thermococcus profundus TaxID=49899 RepID=A0A2Z2M6B7_THEPR|nr:KH domain-containing protein [Thermococcus profundus]ASJ01860.1 transcription elongation factor NusA [Thermococcus profundus]